MIQVGFARLLWLFKKAAAGPLNTPRGACAAFLLAELRGPFPSKACKAAGRAARGRGETGRGSWGGGKHRVGTLRDRGAGAASGEQGGAGCFEDPSSRGTCRPRPGPGHTEGGWILTSTPHDPSGLQDSLRESVQRDCTSGLSGWRPTAQHAWGPQPCGPGFVSKLSDSAGARRLAESVDVWMDE